MKNMFELYNEIFNDIEKNNIKGYIELQYFYEKNNEEKKALEIRKNHKCFYEYIVGRNRELKQKFYIKEFYDKI